MGAWRPALETRKTGWTAGSVAVNPPLSFSRKVRSMSDAVATSLSDLSYDVTCEFHLTNGSMFRGDYVDNIGISGEIAPVWFIVHDERRGVKANDFVSAAPVS